MDDVNDKNGKKIYRLFSCSRCLRSNNKNITHRMRDKNAAINILNLTRDWLYAQDRRESMFSTTLMVI